MNSLIISVNAVFPFLAYLAFGAFLKRSKIVNEPFLDQLNQFVFVALFPITMFYNTHQVSINIQECFWLVLISILTLFAVIVLSFIVVCHLVKENAKRGVIIQAIYRSNIVLYALPLTENLFGQEGAALASIMVALFVPIYNIVAIIVLEYFHGESTDLRSLLLKVLHNPLFLGAVAGIVFAMSPFQLPECLENTVKTLSGLTTPLALIVLGGTTKLTSIKHDLKYLLSALLLKMVILPMITLGIALKFNFGSLELFIYFILFATPIAVGSYSMAENMGGDGRLAGEFVSVSTVISILTLFLWILFLKSTALI